MSLFNWIRDNIDESVCSQKHRTDCGDFLGMKYFITLKNTKRAKPIELVQFSDDRLCWLGFSAWISEDLAKEILLTLKKGLEND